MLSPTGKTFTQQDAARLSKYDRLIFLCGRYEGFDARIENLVDEKISVGDFVLSGGELPALTVTEAIVRLIPGVLGNVESLTEESHNQTTPNPSLLRRGNLLPLPRGGRVGSVTGYKE